MRIRDDDYSVVPAANCGGAFTAPQAATYWRVDVFRERGPHLRFDTQPPLARSHSGIGIWCPASGSTPALVKPSKSHTSLTGSAAVLHRTQVLPPRRTS